MTVFGTHLRVARATSDIQALLPFYRDGLGFNILGDFADHDGFDGVMLGHDHAPYHLEFVCHADHKACRAPTPENLLVFYFPDKTAWDLAVTQMKNAGNPSVTAANPYWDRRGLTFEDPDGYRVVFQRGTWPPEP